MTVILKHEAEVLASHADILPITDKGLASKLLMRQLTEQVSSCRSHRARTTTPYPEPKTLPIG